MNATPLARLTAGALAVAVVQSSLHRSKGATSVARAATPAWTKRFSRQKKRKVDVVLADDSQPLEGGRHRELEQWHCRQRKKRAISQEKWRWTLC